MLTLPIKKKWFDMIKSGEKTEEYREINPYYDSRFLSDGDRIVFIKFRNGYFPKSPYIICRCYIYQDYGNPEWGAEKDKLYYVLKILCVEEVKEWK